MSLHSQLRAPRHTSRGRRFAVLGLILVGMPLAAHAQRRDSGSSMRHEDSVQTVATQSPLGQDAFAAIADVVRTLEKDPRTDWSRVNLEALRQHLIDMSEVTLHAAVKQINVPGGARMDVTGTGRTVAGIRRMLLEHAPMLDEYSEWTASAKAIPGGARLTVTAREPGDLTTATRIRGLGFIGLLVTGSHHREHHLGIARGEVLHHP
jgi:hypothetical protein